MGDPYDAGDPGTGGVLTSPPNITCLSQGYSVLVTDPFDINKTSPSIPVFTMKSSSEMVPGTAWGKMSGVSFGRIPSGSQSSQSILMKTAAEFQQTSSEHVGFEIDIPEVFNASSSVTFSHFREDKSSRENFVCFSRSTRSSYRAHLDMTSDELEINPEFLRRAQALPGDYNYNAYEQFLSAIGTHYVSQVDMGGMVYMSKVVTTDVYSKLTREGVDFQATANGVFDAVKAGGKVELKDEKQLLFQSEVKIEKTDLKYIGGEMNPSADDSFVTWSASVDANPQPINVKVRPIHEVFEQRYLGRCPATATPGEEPGSDAKLWSAKKANLQRAMVEYLRKNGIRYIEHLKDAVPFYQYAGGQPVPERPGNMRMLGVRLGTVAPTGPQGASWERRDYLCMAFKAPNADCVPVYEYRNPATELYKYSTEALEPGWERVRVVFHAPKTPTNYSQAIHAWGFNKDASQYQAKGDNPPIGTYWQSKPLPGGGEGAWAEQRPMDDQGLVFYGVSTRIATIR
jgi:hypothetical protein